MDVKRNLKSQRFPCPEESRVTCWGSSPVGAVPLVSGSVVGIVSTLRGRDV